MSVGFIYFDLGNVLLNFDRQRQVRQMAEVAGIDVERVQQVLFESDVFTRYELGHIDSRQFYETFCKKTGTRPDFETLELAGSDIFDCNATVLPLLVQLEAAGFRLGILSNTNHSHWTYCKKNFGTIPEAFEVSVLSYEVHALKPDSHIFHVAADRARVPPQEIFFVDDQEENVQGARQFGLDAVQYTTATQLAHDLRERGVRCNY